MAQINAFEKSSKRGVKLSVAIAAVLLALGAGAQVIYTQSFDGSTFPPTGWSNVLTSGSNSWYRVTTGVNPAQSPHSGAGEAEFDSYDYSGGVRAIVTPPFTLVNNTSGATVGFWMYRDNGYNTTADKVDVYYNTAANLTGATLLGTVNRAIGLAPTVASNGWYNYTFTIPNTVTNTAVYLILNATSAYGNNIFVDDVMWTAYPPMCSGTPSTATAALSPSVGCPNVPFSISTVGTPTDAGVSFQWQSATSGSGPWSAVSGATLSSYSGATSATTYYRLLETCTVSGLSATTSAVTYSVVNPGPCVCNTYPSCIINYTGDEEILGFALGTMTNVSTCSTTGPGPGSLNQQYSNYAGYVTAPNVCKGMNAAFTISVGTCGGNYGNSCKIYIDWNQNGVFTDAGEQVYVSSGTTSGPHTESGVILVPLTAATGVTRVRVINYEGSASGISSSGILYSWGEVEDYCVNVLAPPSIALSANTASVCPAVSFTTTASGATSYTVNGGAGSASSSTITFAPIATTIYTVTGTDANGCVAPLSVGATATITTLTAPNLTVTPSSSAICIGQSATLTVSGANTYTWAPSTQSTSIVVNPVATTVYTVSGTGTTVCNGVKNYTLTVNPLPTVSVNSGTICEGTSFTLIPTGASTYTYTGPGTAIVSPTLTTTYSVTGTSTAGCISASPAVTTITVIPRPVVTVPSGSICSGQSYLISPAGAASYSLYGLLNPVTPSATSVFSITGTSSVGCLSLPANFTVTVLPLPTVAVSIPTLICSGQPVTLSASGGVTYTWSSGPNSSSITVTPTANTSYYVIGAGSNGCTNVALAPLNVNPSPVLSTTSNPTFLCVGQSATLTVSGADTYSWNTSSTQSNVTVSPTVTTTYTVMGTNTVGCTTAAMISVAVNSIVTTITPPSTVCVGTPVNLVAGGGVSYTWFDNSTFASIVETPSVTSIYSVTIVDANNCSHVMSTMIIVNNLPTISASADTPSACAGDAVVISASGASTYTWSNGLGSGASLTITANGSGNHTYSVTGTDNHGCNGTGQVSFMVTVCTGLPMSDLKGVYIYPNPTTGALFIQKEGEANVVYTVHDVSGRVITKGSAVQDKTEVNIAECVPGVYFLTIEKGEMTRNMKIIKE